MSRPDERRFVLFPRGHVRDQIILAHMRNQMRMLTNPDTRVQFTEDEILRITQPGSRFYIEADAIDLYGQAVQARNSYFVDQIVPHRASSSMLHDVHGPLWLPEGPLVAVGGEGEVTTTAAVGTIFPGSTTIPDPAATNGRDPNGKRYQVTQLVTTDGSGQAVLSVVGIDGGEDTNLAAGTEITWSNPPIGSAPSGKVSLAFDGGLEEESDSDFAKRIEDRIRHRPASGNRAHFRAWARQSSNAVETAFVYACALSAGSVVVCVTQKRGSRVGPLARIPTALVLSTVTGYLVPPSSPVVPGQAFVLVLAPDPITSDMALTIGLRRGATGGWGDAQPWPGSSPSYTSVGITALTDQTHFQLTTDVPPAFSLPASGANAPQMMAWDVATSKFEKLVVSSVASAGLNLYDVVLTSAPAITLAVSTSISPYTDRLEVIESALESYFDLIGPGELVNLATDVRAHRAYRYPQVTEEYPPRAGQGVVTTLLDLLAGAAGDAQLVSATVVNPPLPTNITDGPQMITMGRVGIYDLV